jgi:hypothetical protein
MIADYDRFVFVVGAPRCGTTTLSHFLRQHPAVSFPIVKEPHYFAQYDLREASEERLLQHVEEQYLRRFFRADPTRRVGADASVTYLYMPERLEAALRLWPESKFIVALRDPLQMLPSLHRRLIYNGDETIGDFGEAWAASADRAAGRRIPRRCAEPSWLRYDEGGRYGTYLERLFATVGRERCHVVLFDDLSRNPAEEYRRLCEFAGLPVQEGLDMAPKRSGAGVRIQWLQRLLKRPPTALRDRLAGELFNSRVRDLDAGNSIGPSKVLSLRKRLLRWNRVPAPTYILPSQLQEEICSMLRPEIDRLGELIGRDLGSWLKPRPRDSKQPTSRGLLKEASA